jgi:hypothetical protein
LPLFLPKGRNIIQRSWISFYMGAFFTAWHTTFRGGDYLVSFFSFLGGTFSSLEVLSFSILYCIYWMYVIMGGS